MTRSSTKKLITSFENPKSAFRSKKRLYETPGLVESSSPELDLFSDIKEHSEEETTGIMTEKMEQYMSKTRGNYGSGVVLEIVDLFHIPEVTLKTKFLNKYCPHARTAKKMEEINNFQQESDESLFRAWERFKELLMKCTIPTKTAADAKIAIQEMAEYFQKWHNDTSSKSISTETSNGLAAIQTQLNNLGREIKKVNEKVYDTQVGCEFGAPYQPAGQYRAAGPGFYQHNNGNSLYPDRRQTLEESLTKFMAESAKRHEENSNIIKEIRASIDAAIRNQGASIKTLEIQSLKAQDVKILEAYDHTLPQNEKDPRSFTLPCFIHNVCFDKALVNLGASVSVMPFSTYTNLGLGILSHTRLTIELADRTIKKPRGIAKNLLVRIDKFIFPIDFIILDIPKDDDVPLILGRPFLSTAHSKIDVYKRKINLRVEEEKLVFKSIKPTTSIIRRVFMLTNLDSKSKLIGEDNESFDPLYGNYIKLNDLDTPLEPETNQDVDFEPTIVNESDNVKTSSKYHYKMKFSCTFGYKNVNAEYIPSLFVNLITKIFYYSIIKDKDSHKGKTPAETLIDIPVFVGKFSILAGFIIIDDEDVIRDVVLGMPFFMKYVSCQTVMRKFAHEDKCERMMEK
ncbi:ribonuclease H-like domain-containing protein [Tanacetum coccineum]